MTTDALLAKIDPEVLGRRIRDTRRERQMTQEELAGSDISGAYVSRIESGQRRPELSVAALLAERLTVSLEFLLTGVEQREAETTRLILRHAELALNSGDAASALDQVSPLLAEVETLGTLGADVCRITALAEEACGDYGAAIEFLQMAGQLGMDRLESATALSRCYRESGDLARAIDIATEGHAWAASAGLEGSDEDVRLQVTLVAAYYERGDHTHAAQICREAIAAAELNASDRARSAAYWNASIVASREGNQHEALIFAERALTMLEAGEADRNLGRLRSLFGRLLLRQETPEVQHAEEQIAASLVELTKHGGSPIDLAWARLGLAQARLLANDIEAAIEGATEVLRQTRDTAPFVAAEAETIVGRAHFDAGRPSEAQQHFRGAVARLTAAQADREVAQLWYQLGDLLDAVGDDRGARDAYRSAAASAGLRGTTLYSRGVAAAQVV